MKLSLAIRAVFSLLAFFAAAPCSAVVTTLNLDFGNAAAYVGASGVLSSPGGTQWNKVPITSFPPGSGIGTQFHFPELLNEFGQPFSFAPNPFYETLPNASSGLQNAYEMTSTGLGPLKDGVHATGGDFYGIGVRELSTFTPIDVVVYFLRDDSIVGPQINSVGIMNSGGLNSVSTSDSPTGFFPGVEGQDYLRFTNITATPTTIGIPQLHGVNIAIPFSGVANIAAIQIRGDFVSTPEPGSLTMTLLAFTGLFGMSRKVGIVAC
jgi:hypothetical protein